MKIMVYALQITVCIFGFYTMGQILYQQWMDKKMSRIYQDIINVLVETNAKLMDKLIDLETEAAKYEADRLHEKWAKNKKERQQ